MRMQRQKVLCTRMVVIACNCITIHAILLIASIILIVPYVNMFLKKKGNNPGHET